MGRNADNSDSCKLREEVGDVSGARGMAEIPLDLSEVPTVEAGLAKARELARVLAFDIYKGAMTAPGVRSADENLVLTWHLPLMAFLNRAVSLHRGIVSMIEQANPHATFTLMRAYLELVVLLHYANRHPMYLNAVANPPDEMPEGFGRKSWRSLLDAAAKEMAGVNRVYKNLVEMAHFGYTAMWAPFQLDDPNEGVLRYGTSPHWKRQEDARIAVAMLMENSRVTIELLGDWVRWHVWPEVARATVEGRQDALIVAWDLGHVAWWSPEVWTVYEWDYKLLLRVATVLESSAIRRRSEKLEDGTIREEIDELPADGSRDHAEAALLGLPGARSVSGWEST